MTVTIPNFLYLVSILPNLSLFLLIKFPNLSDKIKTNSLYAPENASDQLLKK